MQTFQLHLHLLECCLLAIRNGPLLQTFSIVFVFFCSDCQLAIRNGPLLQTLIFQNFFSAFLTVTGHCIQGTYSIFNSFVEFGSGVICCLRLWSISFQVGNNVNCALFTGEYGTYS